ncbi:MFS transporter [bacterium]|nr:MFS transporter [bacterium]
MVNIFIIPFIYAFIGSSLFIAIPLRIIDLGVSNPFILGLAGSAFSIFYAPLCIIQSLLSNRINKRTAILSVSITYPFIILGFLLFNNILAIIVLCGLMGIVLSMFWPTYQSHITIGLNPVQATRSLQEFNIGWGSASVIGCFTSGVIISCININMLFILNLILSFIGIYLVARHIHNKSTNPIIGYAVQNNHNKNNPPQSKFFLILAWIGVFAVFSSIGVIIWLFPKFAIDAGMSPLVIGSLRAVLGILQIAIFFILRLNHRWQYSFSHLLFYELMLIFGLVILVFSHNVMWWILAFSLIGISVGFLYSSSLFYSSQARSGKKEKTGLHEAILVSGSLFGTLLGGIMAKTFSAFGAYSMCIIFMIICIVIQLVVRFRYKIGNGRTSPWFRLRQNHPPSKGD